MRDNSELPLRDTQTQVKHLILNEYLNTWGGIILHGLRGPASQAAQKGHLLKIHLIYVDGFSSGGRFAGDHSSVLLATPTIGQVFGSPIIGIQALDKLKAMGQGYGLDVTTNAILVEKRRVTFRTLEDSLEIAGLKGRITHTSNFRALRNGDIAVLNEDFCQASGDIRAYTTDGKKFSFYLLDPWGPSGIPLNSVVAPIIRLPRTDVMINLMYQDLHKKAGCLLQDQVSPRVAPLICHYDNMFGGTRWQDIYRKTVAATPDSQISAEVETALVQFYGDVLRQADAHLAVKEVRLRFPSIERTMFHLFLTTHDGTGALALNEILDRARLREYELRQQFRVAKEIAQSREQGQLAFTQMLLPLTETPTPVVKGSDRPDIPGIADEVYQQFAQQQVEYRDILRAFADSPYYPGEMQKALRRLRQEGRASYGAKSSIANSDMVSFR